MTWARSTGIWRFTWVSAIAYLLLALLCFGRLLGGGFLVDDWWWSATARRGGWPALGPGSVFYRPVSSFVFVEWYHLFGPNPLAYRNLILVLLVATAVCIRALWLTLSRSNSGTGIAFAAGAAFILWPTHAEAVGWISCFSDQLVAAFGTMSIYLYLRFIDRPKAGRLILSFLAMAVALLSKESAVVFPVIAAFLGWAHAKGATVAGPAAESRLSWNWTHLIAAIVITAGYIMLRAQSLHSLMAGYGRNGPAVFVSSLLGLNLTTNLANDFLPFSRYLALYGGGHGVAWVQPLTLSVVIGVLGALIRKPGRSEIATPTEKRLVTGFLIVTFMWLCWIFLFGQIAAIFEIVGNGAVPLKVALVGAIILVLFLALRVGRRNWDDLVNWWGVKRFTLAWVPAAILTVAIMENTEVVGPKEGIMEALLLAGLIWVLYATRPLRVQPTELGQVRVGVALLISAIVALLPSLTLPIGLDGQQSRFSYLGTIFSVLFFICVADYVLKDKARRAILAIGVAVALFAAQWPAVGEWAMAGRLSKETAAQILATPSGKTTYVLAAPESYGAALLFIGGLDSIPFVARGDSTSRVVPVSLMENFVPGDGVRCFWRWLGTYSVAPIAADVPRMLPLHISEATRGHGITVGFRVHSNEAIVDLGDLKVGDRVVYVDGSGPHVLD
jgi:hypothetical protein